MRFRTTILTSGKTAAGIEIPPDVLTDLGAGRKPPVTVTINGHTYRSTVATVDGRSMVGVSVENRAKAGVEGGQTVDVEIQLDTAPRIVEVRDDFAAALAVEPGARAFFEGLSNSEKGWFVGGIRDAKTPETRQRRIDKAIERLKAGRGVR
jgi:hypothetical protein